MPGGISVVMPKVSVLSTIMAVKAVEVIVNVPSTSFELT